MIDENKVCNQYGTFTIEDICSNKQWDKWYQPPWSDGLTICDSCLALKGSANGLCEPLSDFRKAVIVAYLQWKLSRWKQSLEKSKLFDDTIKNLILITLATYFHE